MFAAAALMTGCTADGLTNTALDEVPVNLTVAVQTDHATRAATDVLSGGQFGSGEAFYAYFPTGVRIGGATSACGSAFITDGSGATTPVTQPFFNATATSADICAYYPYVEGKQVTNSTTSFSVELDQSSETGYKKSDLMVAMGTVTKTSPTATLVFRHMMSKIIVNVTVGEGITAITGVRIVGGSKTIAIANPTTNSHTTYLGSVSTATADQITADADKCVALYNGNYTATTVPLACAALIPSQTVGASAATAFLQIVTPAGTATYTLNNKTFASGVSYTYNITVTAAAIGATADINNWVSQNTFYIKIDDPDASLIEENTPSGAPQADGQTDPTI